MVLCTICVSLLLACRFSINSKGEHESAMILVSAVHTKVMYTDESCMLCVDSEELKNSFTLSGPATNSYFSLFLDCTQHQNEVMTS